MHTTPPIRRHAHAIRAAGLSSFQFCCPRCRSNAVPLPPATAAATALSPPRVFCRPAVSLEVSAFLRGLVRRAAPCGLRDPAEDVRAAAARAVRLVMRRFLLQQARTNGDGSKVLVHAVQRREKGAGGSGTRGGVARGSGGSGGGSSGGGIDGGEVFDLVWEALEGLDQDSACVEVRVPWGVRCVFEMQKQIMCFSRQMPRPGGCLYAFPCSPQSGAFLRGREISCSWIWLPFFRRGVLEREPPLASEPACDRMSSVAELHERRRPLCRGSARRTRRPHGAPVSTTRRKEDSRYEHAHVRIFRDTETCRSNMLGESSPISAASHIFRIQAAMGRVLLLSRAFCFARNPTAKPLFGAC